MAASQADQRHLHFRRAYHLLCGFFIFTMDGENLYDEFGNYIGPELDDDEAADGDAYGQVRLILSASPMRSIMKSRHAIYLQGFNNQATRVIPTPPAELR